MIDVGGDTGARTRRLFEKASDVPWWIHRIATSEEYSDGLIDVKNEWSTRDLYHAHKVLDVYAKVEEQNRNDTDPKP